MRAQFDARGAAEEIVSAITPVETNGVSGEWVIAPNANPERRLLYIHGGGYVMGSPTSHRPIASRLSEVAGAAVFSVKYRLMPENSRLASVEDCRRAYRWLLENGPDGQSIPQTLIVAGDSAGGNLALATVAWARDVQLRAASVVVVFSP
ncbi:alpha/beta hydrolase, partial [Rhizobiaceae sp. 2RAB30]